MTPQMSRAAARAAASRASTSTGPDAGQTLLLTQTAWWDGLTYAGSGNWLNRGTAGATGNLVPGTLTAAPTFTTDHFTFDGSNDFMATVGHVAAFEAPNKNTPFEVGVVCSFPAAATNFGTTFHQCESVAHPGWRMTNTSTNRSPTGEVNDTSNRSTVAYATPVAVSTKALFIIGATSGGTLFAQINNGTPNTVADARTAASTGGSSSTVVGRSADGVTFQKVDVYSLIINNSGALWTSQNITDIAAHYGFAA